MTLIYVLETNDFDNAVKQPWKYTALPECSLQ